VKKIAEFWSRVQRSLLPELEECLGELTERHRKLVLVLEMVRVEEHVFPAHLQWLGRKRKDRKALARAFVAKAVYNETTTNLFIERLKVDKTLRGLCGWERLGQIPSESTFSRAFAEFARTALLDRVHEALVKEYVGDDLFFHLSRDSTAIEARETPVEKPSKEEKPKYRRGRPKKGEIRPKAEPKRVEVQYNQDAYEAISQLPKCCDVGTKIDSKGSKRHWVGYKFHVDVVDGCIPISAVTTSASVHDSQVAIPLAKISAERITSLYDLMDSAYDAKLIHQVCYELGHVPIIDQHPGWRHGEVVEIEPDRARRYCNRTTVERFNSRLKDSCGGRNVRVRGHHKVHAHLMAGLLVVFVEAVLRL
jgi:hypothetical protein